MLSFRRRYRLRPVTALLVLGCQHAMPRRYRHQTLRVFCPSLNRSPSRRAPGPFSGHWPGSECSFRRTAHGVRQRAGGARWLAWNGPRARARAAGYQCQNQTGKLTVRRPRRRPQTRAGHWPGELSLAAAVVRTRGRPPSRGVGDGSFSHWQPEGADTAAAAPRFGACPGPGAGLDAAGESGARAPSLRLNRFERQDRGRPAPGQ
jgi:hypothetical protein